MIATASTPQQPEAKAAAAAAAAAIEVDSDAVCSSAAASPTSSPSATPSPPSPVGQRPFIIFDWDDTLLSSTWITSAGLRLDFPAEIPSELTAQLRLLEESVVRVLERALASGIVVIITNAETGWVELSARRFIPKVVPLLSRVRVISARSTYESQFPGSPLDWKVRAFCTEVDRAVENLSASTEAISIISFGDSIHERDAVHYATRPYAHAARTKSIKFIEKPTLEQLRREIELVHSCFEYVCQFESNLDLMLTIQLLDTPDRS